MKALKKYNFELYMLYQTECAILCVDSLDCAAVSFTNRAAGSTSNIECNLKSQDSVLNPYVTSNSAGKSYGILQLSLSSQSQVMPIDQSQQTTVTTTQSIFTTPQQQTTESNQQTTVTTQHSTVTTTPPTTTTSELTTTELSTKGDMTTASRVTTAAASSVWNYLLVKKNNRIEKEFSFIHVIFFLWLIAILIFHIFLILKTKSNMLDWSSFFYTRKRHFMIRLLSSQYFRGIWEIDHKLKNFTCIHLSMFQWIMEILYTITIYRCIHLIFI